MYRTHSELRKSKTTFTEGDNDKLDAGEAICKSRPGMNHEQK